jgi:virginiamycin B lyase
VWVSDFGSNSIFVFDEQSATFQTVTLPDNPANVRQLSGHPGELWGAESAADKIVRVKTDCA